ncbi:MAG: HEPN domain-containing protein [Gemmatimonadota bacterium]
MSVSPEALRLSLQWVEKAENDLLTAEHTLGLGEACPTDMICFHAQQCVEKYLKAVLGIQGIAHPRTHDVAHLIALLPEPSAVGLEPEEQERLTDYATVTRYPGDYEPISVEEARAAVEVARRARDCLRGLLPPEASSGPGFIVCGSRPD